MSPTIFRDGPYRFFFNSREESRCHVHVKAQEGIAKYWIDPIISLSAYYNLNSKQLREIARLIEEHENDIRSAWDRHFSQ
ncbi:MAG: DUF4160 domain-containing protein [Candidatus Sumerlaeota bacterium]|nr:DUF4160 domain-containing protein [Candidatus Sumerlaeota bacterium]